MGPVVILCTPGFTGRKRCREEEMLTVMNDLTRKHAGGAKGSGWGSYTSFAASRSSRETLVPPRTEKLTQKHA